MLPSGKESTVTRIVTFDGDLEYAPPGQAITVTFADESTSAGRPAGGRGEKKNPERAGSHRLDGEESLQPGRVYDVKLATKKSRGQVEAIRHRIEINKLDELPASELKLNEIGLCEFSLTDPVAFDPYKGDPRHRQLHPHRPADQRHRRCRHDSGRAGGQGGGRAIQRVRSGAQRPGAQALPHWQALTISNDSGKE